MRGRNRMRSEIESLGLEVSKVMQKMDRIVDGCDVRSVRRVEALERAVALLTQAVRELAKRVEANEVSHRRSPPEARTEFDHLRRRCR